MHNINGYNLFSIYEYNFNLYKSTKKNKRTHDVYMLLYHLLNNWYHTIIVFFL